jgi:hypothetical protein
MSEIGEPERLSVDSKIEGVGLTASGFAFGELLDKAPSNQGLMLLVGPDFVGFLHSGLAPWARRHPPSMAGGGSRGIHAARPTERDLRSACTQVAIGGDWT